MLKPLKVKPLKPHQRNRINKHQTASVLQYAVTRGAPHSSQAITIRLHIMLVP